MKYAIIVAALFGAVLSADMAEARGRRGCSSCSSCPGGVCGVPASSGKYVATPAAPATTVVRQEATTEGAAVANVTTAAPTVRVASTRRFLRRR